MRALLSRVRSITARALSRQTNCTPAKPRRGHKLSLEELTDRVTPAIWWVNQFNDGFETFYGPNAAAARAVVNQAIADWANAVTDFHYFQVGLNNTFTAQISAASLAEGVRGETTITRFEPETRRPTHATIRLDNDGAGAGWYIDPVPASDSEFNDTQNRYMAHSHGFSGVDLYRTIAHELGHALGLVIGRGGLIDDQLVPVPGAEGRLWNIYTPGPTIGLVGTIDASSHLYGGEGPANYAQFPGTLAVRDLMNPGALLPVGQQTRQLISDVDLRVLAWGYGYTVNLSSLRQFTPVTHEIGTYRPPPTGVEVGQFHLRHADGTSSFLVGPHDPRAIAGDWDGDGFDEVGTYYAPTGRFLLRDASGNTTLITFGGPNSFPVAGDWNGDGRDDIGVYYPSLARFDLMVLSTGLTFSVDSFGASNFRPIAGDWDGDGVDDLGLYDPNQALFRIRNRDGTKFSIIMGGVGSQPHAGDWDGDGDDEVGTYARSLGRFVLRSNNNPADNTKTIIDFGGANSIKLPIAGNWVEQGQLLPPEPDAQRTKLRIPSPVHPARRDARS